MGLIKAAAGALGGTMADQWREFFYCEAIENADTLVVKGEKQVAMDGPQTPEGSENIISNGSGIAVADGQCMMIVEQGKSCGSLCRTGRVYLRQLHRTKYFYRKTGSKESEKDLCHASANVLTYGGDTGKDQRVYYINTKEIMDNKFGTANPFLFHVVDHNTGLSRDVSGKM